MFTVETVPAVCLFWLYALLALTLVNGGQSLVGLVIMGGASSYCTSAAVLCEKGL